MSLQCHESEHFHWSHFKAALVQEPSVASCLAASLVRARCTGGAVLLPDRRLTHLRRLNSMRE